MSAVSEYMEAQQAVWRAMREQAEERLRARRKTRVAAVSVDRADDPIWPRRESPDGRHDTINVPTALGGGRACWYCGKRFATRTRR